MAKTQVGGLRTVGAREAADSAPVETQTDPAVSTSRLASFKHVFQSHITGLTLSPVKRIVTYPNNERTEDVPYTKLGARLDMVRFVDGFLATDDDELAEAVRKDKRFGSTFWDYRERQQEFKQAQAAEIRRQLASDPVLAAAVLSPTDKKDWDVSTPAKTVDSLERAAEKKMAKDVASLSEEELERLTAPTK